MKDKTERILTSGFLLVSGILLLALLGEQPGNWSGVAAILGPILMAAGAIPLIIIQFGYFAQWINRTFPDQKTEEEKKE